MDFTTTALYHLHQADRVKAFTIHNILQLYAIVELLRTSIRQEKVLMLCEGLTPVLLAQKSCQAHISPTSLVTSTIKAISQLCQYNNVLVCWVNSGKIS